MARIHRLSAPPFATGFPENGWLCPFPCRDVGSFQVAGGILAAVQNANDFYAAGAGSVEQNMTFDCQAANAGEKFRSFRGHQGLFGQ